MNKQCYLVVKHDTHEMETVPLKVFTDQELAEKYAEDNAGMTQVFLLDLEDSSLFEKIGER